MVEGGSVGRRGWSETKVGTPQGAVVSPLLANIYLHYVFDLWVNQWRRKTARGEVIIVRFADDAVLGFERPEGSGSFPGAVAGADAEVRTGTTPGEDATDRVRAICGKTRKRRGEGKPETFDFLGFTHICGKTAKGNWFTIRRQTAKKRLRSKLQAVKQELGKRWHKRVVENGNWLRSVVQGYFNYHAVPGNFGALRTFQREVARMWLAGLRRRSQRDRHSWERFGPIVDRFLPTPRILHPLPGVRFDAKYPR